MKRNVNILILCFLVISASSVVNKGHRVTGSFLNQYSPKISSDEVLNIRVLSQLKVQSLLIAPQKASYSVIMDNKQALEINEQSVLKLSLVNDSIEVKTFETTIGKCKSVKIFTDAAESIIKVKVVSPDRKPRFYDDNIIVSVDSDRLKIINNVRIDQYIAGVSEAEAGSHSTVEFYKVQSILARTYALAHMYKHSQEGFNLCDQVHCQAFYGKTHDPEILQAIQGTKGLVVVDENLQLITAAFHSNSGGETANSEDVWGARTTYLRSVNDSFSLKMPNAKWERRMPTEDWLTYLKLKHNYPVEDSVAKSVAVNFKQYSRKVNLEYGSFKVPLKSVRTDLQLKSTFFCIEPIGDSVLFKGRGFGHGIGMCQEGAMKMTKLGYDYKSVLKFYYQRIHIINLKELNFFKE